MKILVCANSFSSHVVGMSVFSQHLFKVNDTYSDHDIRFLTEDTAISTDKIYKFKAHYPRRLVALDFIFRQFSFYHHVRKIRKDFPFDILVFINLKYSLLSCLLLPKSIKTIGFITEYMTLNATLHYHETYRRLFLYRFACFIERLAARKIDAISVCSQNLKERVVKKYGTNPDKIFVLYLGFDIDLIEFKQRLNPFNQPIKLLFVKSNIRRGAIDILAHALNQLPNYHFILTIIGPTESLKNKINSFFKDVLNVQLNFIGIADAETVYKAMHEHDILCIPSREEALGIANAEGLASGISVVSTREGGIIEVLDNGKNGWLAEPENAEDLAQKLKECIEAPPSVRTEKSRLGRLFVEKHFDYRQLNQAFLETCATLLK
jgi:colanic acid/amylovoran biosynthesis glycosyltransferase